MFMTPHEINMILIAVPIGERLAETWRTIWERVDFGAPVTLRNKLQELVAEGRVQRREVRTNSGFYWVYWRDSTAPMQVAIRQSTVLGAG